MDTQNVPDPTRVETSGSPSGRRLKMGRREFLSAAAGLSLAPLGLEIAGCGPAGSAAAAPEAGQAASLRSILKPDPTIVYLAGVQDECHRAYSVYDDADSACNHFAARGRFPEDADDATVPAMDEACTDQPRSGLTCIRCAFTPHGLNFGGWIFMNGVLPPGERNPQPRWGDVAGAGIDLTGATALTFWARGQNGGEQVEFFCFGVGYEEGIGVRTKPYPDSSRKVSIGIKRLTTGWTQYTIPLNGRNLRYVLGAFGWGCSGLYNQEEVVFFLDNISFNKQSLGAPGFLVSYETTGKTEFDRVSRNAGFTYDNSTALLSFLTVDRADRAKPIADALVFAQDHDRKYQDGGLRNALQGGDLALPAGWPPHARTATVRMPGWYDAQKKTWLEDPYDTSRNTGNIAWAMIALAGYCKVTRQRADSKYLAAAKRLGEWVVEHCRDTRGAGGYTAGYEGPEDNSIKRTYKATEHNIDLYAAYMNLYHLTGDPRWQERAEHAFHFIQSMWDDKEGKFWAGTGDDGVRIPGVTPPAASSENAIIATDIQSWALLSLKERGKPYWRSLDYAEAHLTGGGGGYAFSNADRSGSWYEGSAHMALGFQLTHQAVKAGKLLTLLKNARDPSGGIRATNRDGLWTGFYLPRVDGEPPRKWVYYSRLHVGASAWLALAASGVNPYYMEKIG